jgi:hypothetical protein
MIKTSKSGPVRTGATGLPPTGCGGATPPSGRLTEPPPYTPHTTGAPNRSCTLRIS